MSSQPAHPRVCGENLGGNPDILYVEGSSPRVRGKLVKLGYASNEGRLIPACAGKTQAGLKQSPATPAHPRVCGENQTHRTPETLAQGSSPRVRGKPCQVHARSPQRRLIPACAGKTVATFPIASRNGAHPRVCGENAARADICLAVTGSSPRVRGKLPQRAGHVLNTGLIPACAGKTPREILPPPTVRAHPRVCGENSVI